MTWKANQLALRQGSLFPLCASAVAGVVIITPVLVVMWRSFTSGKLGFTVGLNLAIICASFDDKDLWPMLSNSLVYAGGSALLGTGLGGHAGVDRRAHQYAGKSLGRADAALSAVDAADHEKHRLDSAAGAALGHLKRHAQQFLGITLSGLQRL